MAQVDQKQKWPFSRDVNMREHLIRGYLENGVPTQTKGNPAATPSTLMDFGFWDAKQSLPTPIGKALLENKISWRECVTWVLSKRPSSRDENNIKPFVVVCKFFSLCKKMGVEPVLFKSDITPLSMISSYDEITESWVNTVIKNRTNASQKSHTYDDIWINAFAETVFFEKGSQGKSTLEVSKTSPMAWRGVEYVALLGDLISVTPPKTSVAIEKVRFYEYMGSTETGLIEILSPKISESLFPNINQFFLNLHTGSSPKKDILKFPLEDEFKEWCAKEAKIEENISKLSLKELGEALAEEYANAISSANGEALGTVYSSIFKYGDSIFDSNGKSLYSAPALANAAVDASKGYKNSYSSEINKAFKLQSIIRRSPEEYGFLRRLLGMSSQPKPETSAIPMDRLTIALKVFEEKRQTAEWCTGDVSTRKYEFVNSSVREYFDSIREQDISQMSDDEIKEFCIDHTWSLTNGNSWSHVSRHSLEERVAFKAFVERLKHQTDFIALFEGETPKGIGNAATTELLMKFQPEKFCLYNSVSNRVVQFLGLTSTEFDPKFSSAEYINYLSICTRIRDRMREFGIARTLDEADNAPADYLTVNEFLWFVNDNKDLIEEKVMATIYKPTVIEKVTQEKIENFADFIKALEEDVAKTGLKYPKNMLKRFVCALLAKPFTVLTGLSGSGKTKLAQAFAKWIGVENTVLVVPVGADWTNNERLLGFPNALNEKNYVLPDTGVLKFIIDAKNNPDLPFFLILDEMNLSHVERYFADFLSAMESEEDVKLHGDDVRYASDGMPIEPKLKFPANLFIIGTMNVDETTYMFSPKVLDRAQVLEFRVTSDDIDAFLSSSTKLNLNGLAKKGAQYAGAFLTLAKERKTKKLGENEKEEVKNALTKFFPELANLGAEFGYRTASEIVTFVAYYLEASGYSAMLDDEQKGKILLEAIDAAILQKLLPKLHGSRNRLEGVLDVLIKATKKPEVEKTTEKTDAEDAAKLYPLTNEKLNRMKTRLVANNFTSFAEA